MTNNLRKIIELLNESEKKKLCQRIEKKELAWLIPDQGCSSPFSIIRDIRIEVEELRMKILDLAFHINKPKWLNYGEDPYDCEAPGHWEKFHNDDGWVWKVPDEIDTEELSKKYLYYGMWCFYISEGTLMKTPDFSFNENGKAIINHLKELNIYLKIDSFHDQIDWIVAINPDLISKLDES